MKILRNQVLETVHKKPIVFDLYFKPSQMPKPVVLFCHGYKGFKDWGAWDLVANAFAEAGFFFVKFNFSHNGGTPEQPIDFPDLEAFAQNNYTMELDDLERMIDCMTQTKRFHAEADVANLSLIGHSRGGGIIIIKAAEDIRVKKIVTWAAVSDYKVRFKVGSESFQRWKDTGRMYVVNGRTKQQMPHDWQFYENFKKHEERLTIKSAIQKIKQPCLIIHGMNDTTVLPAEANALHRQNPMSDLHLIEGADHVFGACHPWPHEYLPVHLQEVVSTSSQFLS